MYTGQIDAISNKATWRSPTCELVDDVDGTTTDLSTLGAALDIVVTIKDMNGCTLATASIANGKVTILGPGFQWQFEVSDLSNLCAGTYRLGAKVTISGFVTDLIDGTVAVIEGN
jgi:hypothetical protein